MGKKALWLTISCLVVATLVLASCGRPATGEEVTGEEPEFTLKGEYTNQEFGFSIEYPAEYEEETPRSNEVFRARALTGLPVLTVSILDTKAGATLAELKDIFTSGLELAGMADVEFVVEKEGTLSDGVTPAYELEIKYDLAGYDLRTLYLWVVKHHKWFLVAITTTAGFWNRDKAIMKEIVHTFTTPTWTPATVPENVTFTADVPMRDDKTLPAFVILPGETGSYPVIFIYTAYGARLYQSAIVMAAGDNDALFGPGARAIFGYVVVNRRGRHESTAAYYEGAPTVGEDGADVVKWIAAQPWSSGKIGMFGSSADGTSQYLTAAEQPESLTAIAPSVAPGLTETYLRYYPGGVLREANWRVAGELWPTLWNTVVDHPQMDYLWQLLVASRPKAIEINVPAILINGWWDHNVEFVFDAYQALRTQSARGDKTRLVIGPWSHFFVGKLQQGELQYPAAEEANKAYIREFYDYWLRGIDNGIYNEPPIHYYQLGEEVWKSTAIWPPPGTSEGKYYLRSGHRLSPEAPVSEFVDTDRYIYDPDNPSPAIGGPFLGPSQTYPSVVMGPAYQDDEVIGDRDDYLIYDSDILVEDLEIAGTPRVRLYIECDRPDTDLIIRLCDYGPDGPRGRQTLLITTGPQRMRYRQSWTDPSWMEVGEVYEVDIRLDPIGYTWKKGHQVRIIVTSSNYPLYALNPNNKNHFIWDEGEPLVASIKVHHDSTHPSHLILPVRE